VFKGNMNYEQHSLPPAVGSFVAAFQTQADASKCKAGVQFHNTQPSSVMTLDEFEIRELQPFEANIFSEEDGARAAGVVANPKFGIGSLYWQRINSKDEVWMNGRELVVWNHGKPAGQHTGVQQTGLKLKPNTKYSLVVNGQVKRNGSTYGEAQIFVSKTTINQQGVSTTTGITKHDPANLRMPKAGASDTKVEFKTDAEQKFAKSTTYNVGVRFDGHTPPGVEIFIHSVSVDTLSSETAREKNQEGKVKNVSAHEQYLKRLDAERVARKALQKKACNCDPRVHSSKATKCYARQTGWTKRNNVIRVVHRKSMIKPVTFENIGMDQADEHKCQMVDGECKCCDCKQGVTHGLDLASLQDGRTFTVRFNRSFKNKASNLVKPGMTGTCRFDQAAKKWCCACTNSWLGDNGKEVANRCPYNYGDEFCYAYNGNRNPEGINFWGHNYHFKEYHRCVTPAHHHVCGENVKADKSKSQDIGHLPYFDNNALNQWDGFAIVNNALALTDNSAKYTRSNNVRLGCARSQPDQVGGIGGHQVLSASDCAALCDHTSNCAGFNLVPFNGKTVMQTKCEFIAQASAKTLRRCVNKEQATLFYSKTGFNV